jgi:hypothetical protein
MLIRKRDYQVAGMTALVIFLCLLCVGIFAHIMYRAGGVAPDPAPVVVKVKGDRLVVIVDDANPSVPEGRVLDGPMFDAIRSVGKAAIPEVNGPLLKRKNYGPLVTAAGGCPTIAALTDGGDLAYVGKLPTDEHAAESLCKQILADCPEPMPAPKFEEVADRGGQTTVGNDGTEFVLVDGHRRYLAAKPDGVKLRAMAPRRYADYHPVFPVKEWRPINRRDVFAWEQYGLDQNGFNSCTAQADSAALTKLRVLAGMKFVKLSPAYLYAHINHGQDKGAVISDAAESLVKEGTCPFDLLGQHPFYSWNLTAEMKLAAKRYRAADVYHVNTWDELGSALQTGRYLAVFAAQVGPNFGHFDKYGVAGHDAGRGNHALHADGMAYLPDGRWVLDVPNSWGEQWGPWHNGRVFLDAKHLFANGDMPDCVVYRAAADDPKEPWSPPAYTGRKANGPEVALAP